MFEALTTFVNVAATGSFSRVAKEADVAVSSITRRIDWLESELGAKLFSRAVQAEQFSFRPGSSEPTGPGINAVGLGIFRYQTRCGTVYGHTGNTSGYTQFMAASRNGRRSVTVSISAQITNKSMGPQLVAFRRLRAIEGDAVCAALS